MKMESADMSVPKRLREDAVLTKRAALELRKGVEAATQAAGGVRALARLLDINHQAVMDWDRIPNERILQIERLTGIPAHILRPDLYRDYQRKAGA
jgi:DNA-binding transcriptional regulator YdaS (Cro superfamily)